MELRKMKKFSGFEEMNCVPHIVDILNSNLTHIFMLIIGGTCCFLPLLLGIKSYLEESTLLTSLTSGGYFRDSSTASLALALPMFLDLLVDFYNQLRRNRKQKVEKQRLCLNGLEKFVLLGGINAVPFVSLLPKDTSNLALILACCHNFRITIVGGIIITSLCRYNRKFWSTSVTITFIIVLSLAEVMSVFVGNIMVKDKHDPLYRNMQYVAIVFTWSPIVLLMVCNIRWLAAVINSWLKSSDHVRVKDSHLYFTMVWVFATISGIIALLINAVLYRTFDKIDEKALLLNNLIFLCFELVVTVFLMRMYKSDSVQGLYALIDSKKSYVRYISHELRTPLNTAFLGLKLLTDELKISGNPVDEARCETLGDVNLSCKAALDILNDLLCFDKLESGILDLHKQELYILPFVHNCVAMFKVQAKEIGVGMVVVNPSIEVTDSDYRKKSHYHRIKHSETILMDKFKMDQVVRNLISNALKFTPRGGTVTITVTYEPIQSIKKDMNHLAFHKVFSKMKPITDRLISTSSMFSMASSNQIFNDLDLETGRNAVDDNFVSVGYLVISVRDTGAGISEVNQKRLFNDIVQFNPEILQAGGGSGLGLWITKGIVDLHEGEISVHSDGEGCGSVFTCKIPMWRNDEDFGDIVESPCRDLHSAFSSVDGGLDRNLSKSCSFDILPLDLPINLLTMKAAAACKVALESIALSRQGSRRGSAAPKLKPLVHGPHYNLLIVDDSRLNRKMLCKMLRGAGHICDEAEDGLMAVEKVKESMLSAVNETVVAYDAILMDFVMPNMGGPEATKIICGMGFMGPIYGVTGNALEGDIQHFTDCGATQVFTKPLDFGYLQQCMKDALTVVESDTEAEIE